MNKKGFTLIEISLFIAISGAMVLGVILSTRGAISNQRYNDSVQNFYDFLGNSYNKVINVENSNGTGTTSRAIYGKIIVFAQDKDENLINMYDITADADKWNFNVSNDVESLQDPEISDSNKVSYTPTWGGRIEGKDAEELFNGSVIIMRSPLSGAIATFYSSETNIDDFAKIKEDIGGSLQSDIDFCIDTEDLKVSERRNVRISANGQNSSAVKLISDEDESYACEN